MKTTLWLCFTFYRQRTFFPNIYGIRTVSDGDRMIPRHEGGNASDALLSWGMLPARNLRTIFLFRAFFVPQTDIDLHMQAGSEGGPTSGCPALLISLRILLLVRAA